MNAEYRERQKLAGEIFDLLGVRYDKHSGGMFLWGKIDDREESGEKLSDMILQKAHVFITPGFILEVTANVISGFHCVRNKRYYVKLPDGFAGFYM